MGLLKRLFSMGSKKNKKDRPPIVHNVPVPELPWAGAAMPSGSTPIAFNDEEHEAAVGRLLRSTSARFAESSELNYATLPPLPHPINNVIAAPGSSAVSLASTTISSRSTYNVTVHKRWRDAATEVPPVPIHIHSAKNSQATKDNKRASLLADDSRVLRLRSDPSVASLLELYDEHGKVAADAFSNDSPAQSRTVQPSKDQEKDGRAQVRRNGSTLRQLLGASPSLYSHDGNESGSAEGDISWAERFLAESDATSSTTSFAIQTPVTPNFYTQPLKADTSVITDGDFSISTIDNPAISSMEVEVSTDIDMSLDMQDGDLSKRPSNNPYMSANPSTPQRASQVFEFLTRKQSTTEANFDRTLPELPSCFSSPSDENANLNFHFNDPHPSTFAPARISAVPTSFLDNTPRPNRTRPHSIAVDQTPVALGRRESYAEPRSTFSDDSHDPHYAPMSAPIRVHQDPQENTNAQDAKANDIRVMVTGPTKVIVTAPTPSTAHDNVPSRIPRGPRALPSKSSSGSIKRRRSALVELSNANPTSPGDPFIAISAPRRKQPTTHRRSSQSSVGSQQARGSYEREERPSSRTGHHQHKENQLGLSVKAELPATPMRTGSHAGSRSLLRTVVQQAMFQPPSPASSSEMSPVGRQIMLDVRQQRMHAREAERERAAKRSRSDRAQRV